MSAVARTPVAIETCVVETPAGRLALGVAGGRIVALEWTQASPRSPSPSSTDGRVLARAAAQLAAYFAGTRRAFDLPLAPRGTPFQRRVWAAMARIPHGSTASYGQLARDVDSAPRAVGQACAANPIAIIIPCHRVLAGAGRLGGFSGGAGPETKRALLALEGAWPEAKPRPVRNDGRDRAVTRRAGAR